MRERLIQLESNLGMLERLRDAKYSADQGEVSGRAWAIRYGLIESIQIVIDTACAIVNRHNLGVAKTYADCLKRLAEAGYLDKSLAGVLVRIVGLRNLLIHEYAIIDDARVEAAVDDLSPFREYAKAAVAAL
ncbi:MAG: DUF86 domain-containing protein [Spirochaetales bacterium]|nr:DUF86 domain-containing protein [Spirochaetales bacterium]